MHRSRSVALIAVALLAAGCTSTANSSTGTASRSAAPPSGSTVSVPDAYTPLTITPLGASTEPFLGSDQKYHIAYDLQLTNWTDLPVTVDKVDVVDGADPMRVIASFSGTALVDPGCEYGNCNRLRMLTARPATSTTIPAQEGRVLLVDFTLDSLAQAPHTVLHHFFGTGKAGPAARQPSAVDYLAAPYDLAGRSVPVISPPVRGNNWIALNGCCEPGLPHRGSFLPLSGQFNDSQRFAIDWKRANDQGQFYVGDKTKNESYVDYGADVYAVADGTVVSTLDDVDANAPGVLPASDPALAAKLTIENVDGNHIILDLGGGVYAMYAHFIKGSLLVKPGDKVKKGQVIAKLGNTGNANASHLHFQLMDGPSLAQAHPLPYVFDHFSYDGQVAVSQLLGADDYLTGNWLQGKLASPQPRTNQLPTNLAIVNFG